MDGDSALELSIISIQNGTYSQLWTMLVDGVSGPDLLTLSASHVATHFERQNRGGSS